MHATCDANDRPDSYPEAPARVTAGPPRLGIVGGGQLAKMLAQAAAQLGCEVVVLERTRHSPAARLAPRALVGDYNDPAQLLRLATLVDGVTLENEFVDADSLRVLEAAGHQLRPSACCLALVQDKFLQKQTLAATGLPMPRFAAVASLEEVERAGGRWGWPLLLKARRNAYDGKGNVTLPSFVAAAAAWAALGGEQGRGLYVEEFCDFRTELAVIVTRSPRGEMVTYPVVETVQRHHICHLVRAPAPVSAEVAAHAAELAQKAAAAVGVVGSCGVELFLTRTGQVLINELAPRVHNSGHYTIEACGCSQFENHLRAVLGWPLGSPRMRAPAAVMINLLGVGPGPGWPEGLERALAVPGAHVHVYGKPHSARGRKMGHVTALGESLEAAEMTARAAAEALRFGTDS